MTEERKLELLLTLFREALDRPSYMTDGQMQQARKYERLFADRVMFNLGFHKAKSTGPDDRLVGFYATENLFPILLNYTELVQGMSRLPEQKKKPGRRPGSYEDWHYSPGYQVVIAFDETRTGGRSLPERIRRAVKDGWLNKSVPDKTHARRVGLIRGRIANEEAERLKAAGDNIVQLRPRKKRDALH